MLDLMRKSSMVGIRVFALTGALVASRKQMDIVGFALLGSVTGIGAEPSVMSCWVRCRYSGYKDRPIRDPVLPFPAWHSSSPVTFSPGRHLLLWCDAVGLALFSVTGTEIALSHGVATTVAIAMGVATAAFGGIIRDILGGDAPVILRREIYGRRHSSARWHSFLAGFWVSQRTRRSWRGSGCFFASGRRHSV